MTMNRITVTRSTIAFDHGRKARFGMTLLEVLVAIGILVAGLASVAALLPAAGARLADATAIDRAGALAANAHADLRNRGVLTSSPSLFPANTIITASSSRICLIGQAFPDTPFASGTYAFTSGTFNKYPTASLAPTFSMNLQDDVRLSATNSIESNPTSVSYSVTIVPTGTGTISAGSPVRVGVAVFKRPDVDWMEVPLKKVVGGLFEVNTTGAFATPEQKESIRKRFLPACSWAFAAKGGDPAQSRWLRVGSSWTTSGTSYVSFSDAEAEIITTSSTLAVQSFTNILHVDERPAILR